MRKSKRFLTVLLGFLLCLSLIPGGAEAAPAAEYTSTILFTHDMHAHFLPTSAADGGERGGFARLSTLLQEQRRIHPDALTLDAGDFSMGSLFQSIYATEAPELRIMGAMGYDATTFGNHEYDFRESGFAAMLESAVQSGETLPQIVESNYLPPSPDAPEYSQEDAAVTRALENYGVERYILLERGGITYGIFGLMGEESDSNAPESGMVLSDPVETAQATVDKIKATAGTGTPLFIICLSHSGTSENPKDSEDENLASKVNGIDLIVSGHSHTVLEQPIQVGNTLIVSAGCYTANLGVLNVGWNADGTKLVEGYELIPVDETVPEDAAIAARIETMKNQVAENYLAAFGFQSFDQVIGSNSIAFDGVDDLYAEHRESGLGDLIADSYLYAVRAAEGEYGEPVTLALTAAGVIRDTLTQGDITVSDVFNVSSLGIGTDGLAGYPLVSAYLTGAEIKAVCEVDASVTPLMPPAQIHLSGITFTWNSHRLIFNKVSSCGIQTAHGGMEALEDDKLYRVVTGLYCAQMLSAVQSQSFGLLSITPKYADGTPVSNFDDCILYDQSGNEIKEWYALASYIQSFPGGEIPARYENSACVSRKVQSDSWHPAALLRGANRLTMAALCIAIVLILLIVLLIRWVIRRILYGKRYGKSAGAYTAQLKKFRQFHPSKHRSRFSPSGMVPRHSRPVAASRRYGKGYRPPQPKKRRKRVSRRKYGKFSYHGGSSPTQSEQNSE